MIVKKWLEYKIMNLSRLHLIARVCECSRSGGERGRRVDVYVTQIEMYISQPRLLISMFLYIYSDPLNA